MFGLFGTKPFRDLQFGDLARGRGYWRGLISLEDGIELPLILSGGRTEPDPEALANARTVPTQYPSWRAQIASALFEHYEPYADSGASDDGDGSGNAPPVITTPEEVWPHVSLVFVSVAPLGGVLTTELGFNTDWDEEHTVSARFRSGRFHELCGSALVP